VCPRSNPVGSWIKLFVCPWSNPVGSFLLLLCVPGQTRLGPGLSFLCVPGQTRLGPSYSFCVSPVKPGWVLDYGWVLEDTLFELSFGWASHTLFELGGLFSLLPLVVG
jgi:hypothetical protein